MRYFRFEEEHPFSLILPLIEEGKLDPWDVDIVELANLYLEELKKREILDLRIPARAIVAASFLLKKKIEVLFPKPPRKPKRRKYSLQEIVGMFEEEYKDVEEEIKSNVKKIKRIIKKKKSSGNKDKRENKDDVPIHISRFEDVLKDIWNLLKTFDIGTRISFLTFLNEKDMVPQFMALLYLDYENKIRIYQEKPYGEIEIEILET
ncbi:segregation/condensation protein A [Aquifex sp.]